MSLLKRPENNWLEKQMFWNKVVNEVFHSERQNHVSWSDGMTYLHKTLMAKGISGSCQDFKSCYALVANQPTLAVFAYF